MKNKDIDEPQASLESGKGERVEKTITLNLPVAQVYAFWRHLENLPHFMSHVQSVSEHGQGRSHWVVKTVGDKRMEWDAEIIADRENEMISWRSLPGADVDNAGSVWFTPVAGGAGTEVRVLFRYSPPAGKLGAGIAKVFGRDAESEVEEDLHRFKELLEGRQVHSPH